MNADKRRYEALRRLIEEQRDRWTGSSLNSTRGAGEALQDLLTMFDLRHAAEPEESPSREELSLRVDGYKAELLGSAGRLRDAREVAERLTEILSPRGPRLPPFTWTAEQKQMLRIGAEVRVHWNNAAPRLKTIRRIMLEDGGRMFYHFDSGCTIGEAEMDPETLAYRVPGGEED